MRTHGYPVVLKAPGQFHHMGRAYLSDRTPAHEHPLRPRAVASLLPRVTQAASGRPPGDHISGVLVLAHFLAGQGTD